MSKELKIKGALGKDFQQIYIGDQPTGMFINEDGKVSIKDLVVKKTTGLIDDNFRVIPAEDFGNQGSYPFDNPTPNVLRTSGDLLIDTNGELRLETHGGKLKIQTTNPSATSTHNYRTVFSIDTDDRTLTLSDETLVVDFFKVEVDTNGVSTISTQDWDGASAHLSLVPDGNLTLDPVSQKVIINATDKLYFDGGTHTYIAETSDDVLDIYVGVVNLMKISQAAVSLSQKV